MPSNSHTVMICTDALRIDTNNMWRGLKQPSGESYDSSPVETADAPRPGTGTHSIPLTNALKAGDPWNSPRTHWMASAWELPTFEGLLSELKAGNVSSRDWAPFNLNQNRARAAGEGLYSRTVNWTGAETDPDASQVRNQLKNDNINTALAELGLQRIPTEPFPF